MLFIIPTKVDAEEYDEQNILNVITCDKMLGAGFDSDIYFDQDSNWTKEGINHGTTKVIIYETIIEEYGYREFYYIEEVNDKYEDCNISFTHHDSINTKISVSLFNIENVYKTSIDSIYDCVAFHNDYFSNKVSSNYNNLDSLLENNDMKINIEKYSTTDMEDGKVYNVYNKTIYSYVYVEYFDLNNNEVIKTGIRGVKDGYDFLTSRYLVSNKDLAFFIDEAK